MKTKLTGVVFFMVFILAANWAFAESIEGKVQGFHCVVYGKGCPKDMMDPIAGAERTFVLVPSTGDGFYLIPNLDRAVLARHLLEKVRVSGMIDKKYNSVMAKTLEVWKNGSWKLMWSMEMEDKMFQELIELR